MNDLNFYKVPVAIIVYNRLDTTRKVMERIQEIKPEKLYVISDAAKSGDESNKKRVAEVRQCVESMINWECDIHMNYAEENMGCKMRVYSGISWVFEQEEQAIILEDDIVPDKSFFPYCEEMLQKYKDDERVMLVSGYNRYPEYQTKEDYVFSCYASMWGWATWRRAWKLCDISMKSWPEMKEKRLLNYIYGDNAASILGREFDLTYEGEINTWDYQWLLTILMNNGVGVVPYHNVVENIGFYHELATHTNNIAEDKPIHKIEFPMMHRDTVLREYQYDQQISEKFYKVPLTEKVLRAVVPAETLRETRKKLERMKKK